MTNPVKVRDIDPVRRNVAARARYQLYRPELREDFNGACGYCGDDDARQDRILFHVDHFAPKKLFPQLELAYVNLVYACRYCNISKSDHWVGGDSATPNNGAEGFIDPCGADYDLHVQRDAAGKIYGVTPLGRYIVKRLKLGLIRHELLWKSRRARLLRDDVVALTEEVERKGRQDMPEYVELLKQFASLTKAIDEYELGAVKR
jgi:uncharacterized protein (TIGR02646 family)